MPIRTWLVTAAGFRLEDRPRPPDLEIEQAEGVVTAASCGVADSGTIVLHHSED
jgi:L-lactate utilization protein LutC